MMKSAKDSHTKKTIVRKNSPRVIFKITRQRKEHINNLADHLSFIAPSTTFGEHSFSIENLAKEWRLSKYFKKQRNKKNDISYFLSNVLRYRKKIPPPSNWLWKLLSVECNGKQIKEKRFRNHC